MNDKVYFTRPSNNDRSETMTKYQIGDIVAATTTIYPKWWQFFRRPMVVPAAYICIAVGV
jgi:hypothetical protein